MHGRFRETQSRNFEQRPQQNPSIMDRNRQQEFRQTALGIAYAFLGPAGNISSGSQWPSRSEHMSTELYNQVIAEFEAHKRHVPKDKAACELARQAFEETYSNRGRSHDHPHVQPSMADVYTQMQPQPSRHGAPRHPDTNLYPEEHSVPQPVSLEWPQPQQQARYREAGPMQGEASGSGLYPFEIAQQPFTTYEPTAYERAKAAFHTNDRTPNTIKLLTDLFLVRGRIINGRRESVLRPDITEAQSELIKTEISRRQAEGEVTAEDSRAAHVARVNKRQSVRIYKGHR